jgi:D-inositol-3-phosphate glycosyltransferase
LTRLRAVTGRLCQAVVPAGGALGRLRPRRCTGAVQGPTSLRAGENIVSGWAWYGRDKVVAVLVTIDGEVTASANLGPPPSDVAAKRRASVGSTRCGWVAVVDLARRANQTVDVGAITLTRSGLSERLPGIRCRVRPTIGAHLEQPTTGSTVPAGPVEFAGWALPPQPVDRIELRVDGTGVGLARPLAQARPELAAQSADPAACLAGFTHTVALRGAPGTSYRIDGVVVSTDGSKIDLDPVDFIIRDAPEGPPFDVRRVEELRARTRALGAATLGDGEAGLRLVVFTHRLDVGGGQLYLSELLRQLLAERSRSCLVVSEVDGVLRRELENNGAVVHITDFPVRSPEAYESKLLELAYVVRAHTASAAIINTAGAGIGADLCRLLQIPAAWAIHESFSLDEFWVAAYGHDAVHPYVRKQQADALDATAAVVFEADATRAQYRAVAHDDRLITVPYGVPLAAIDQYRAHADRIALRTQAGLPPDAVALLCVGTFEPRKAQGALVVAFARLAERHPQAVLLLVGDQNVPYAVGVREVVRRVGLGDRIRLAPVVPDTYAWYAMADAFVIASDIESLPRSALEVMAFGVPVVASSVFGLPELISDGMNGILFPPRDVGALTRALDRLLSLSPAERAAIGAAGEATVRRSHDSSSYAAAYERLLTGLIADPKALPADLLTGRASG